MTEEETQERMAMIREVLEGENKSYLLIDGDNMRLMQYPATQETDK